MIEFWNLLKCSIMKDKIMKKHLAKNLVSMIRGEIFAPVTTWLFGWLFGFNGISTFVGYLMLNPFLWKQFYIKQFSLV